MFFLLVTKSVHVFRLYVRNFWSQEKRLPTATIERMLIVLRSLYSRQIERCFLSLATNLLLEMTSQSPDFKRNMFEYPLSECTFQVDCLYLKHNEEQRSHTPNWFSFSCLFGRTTWLIPTGASETQSWHPCLLKPKALRAQRAWFQPPCLKPWGGSSGPLRPPWSFLKPKHQVWKQQKISRKINFSFFKV